MEPSVDDALSREIMAVLVHLKKLLRVRNQLHSPLLRLPDETIVRILSLIMADLDSHFSAYSWMPIYNTCHRIHRIMCSAPELWWNVDLKRGRVAHFIFVRSKGSPQIIASDTRVVQDHQVTAVENILDHWRDRREFRGHRLHTLRFCGSPSSFAHFSWILKRPLPRLERLRLCITDSPDEEEFDFFMPAPVALQLPMDMPLQVLDLRNVTLPWLSQSRLFNGLRELHLNFRDCDPVVTIPEDELFAIFDASPQLERLSLVRVGHEVPVIDGELLPPKRILQLPNLVFLKLDNSSIVIKYTLSYMALPVIASLEIQSLVPWNIAQTLNDHLFPDDRLPTRLFPNSPTFAVRTVGLDGLEASTEIDIGGAKLSFDFPTGQGERGRKAVMSSITRLVPSSVTTLKLEYAQLGERGWRDFFASHPEVRSIECIEYCGVSVPRSLWDALSPAGEDATVPCPRLESILITSYTGGMVHFPALSDCLQNRQTAGFKLRRLKMTDFHRMMTYRFREEFGPLAEAVEIDGLNGFVQRVSPISIGEICVY